METAVTPVLEALVVVVVAAAQAVAVVAHIQNVRYITMKNSFKYYGVVFLSLFLFCCSEWSQTDIQKTIDIGNDISTKLEVYKSSTGSYPSDLSKLVPNHLLQLDKPSVGNKTWDYEVDGEGYYLGVNGENTELDPVLYRTNKSNNWFMDTK